VFAEYILHIFSLLGVSQETNGIGESLRESLGINIKQHEKKKKKIPTKILSVI
jgi:hypothetical protein